MIDLAEHTWVFLRKTLRHNPAKVGVMGGPLSHPNRQFVDYVCNGIRDGFRVGFNYRSSAVKQSSGNMRSIVEH